MAPSQDRRPGNSRRAQYGIFTGYVIAIFGVVVGIVLLIVSLIDPGAFSFARSAAGEVARPIGQAGAGGRIASQGVIETISGYFAAGSQNAELRREVAAARANAVTMSALKAENARLKALLGVVDRDIKPIAAARLIGSTATSTRRFATLSVGARAGVRTGQPVRSEVGLIGRVLEVGPNTARILLVSDAENVVPVRRASDGLPAFVQGGSDGNLHIRLISAGVNPLRKGDVFVTSGSGGLYPPGIPVAIAASPTRDGAIGHLASDPAAAEFVLVEPIYVKAAEQMLDPEAAPTESAPDTPAPAE